ncbi:hypothetical protein [Subtercola lobariae]|uniref:Uncharacterized protein n=1 Tax=Subtercola lobariae TaxID=1588641 RepID=A0A917EV98_9MICO|nr:hypothetical protein [Subtercola lobariae]GGF11326.1 hypothetical protein GCM10011399_01440 [Subtercola lobariae]
MNTVTNDLIMAEAEAREALVLEAMAEQAEAVAAVCPFRSLGCDGFGHEVDPDEPKNWRHRVFNEQYNNNLVIEIHWHPETQRFFGAYWITDAAEDMDAESIRTRSDEWAGFHEYAERIAARIDALNSLNIEGVNS